MENEELSTDELVRKYETEGESGDFWEICEFHNAIDNLGSTDLLIVKLVAAVENLQARIDELEKYQR